MRKRIMAFICIVIMVLSSLPCDYEIQASTVKYVKVNTNYIMKDNYGFTKLTINGKKESIKYGVKSFRFKLKYEGKYVIKTVNKRDKKEDYFLVDGTKPKIKCITSEGKVKVTVTDDRKLSTVSLNGRKVKSKFTISTAGSYKIIAKDKAGNKTARIINVKESESQETEVPVTEVPTITNTVTRTPSATNAVTSAPTTTNAVTSTPSTTADNVNACEHVYQKIMDSEAIKETATCQHGTIYYKKCQRCGMVGTDTWTDTDILAHDHKMKNDVLASVTCQSPATYYYSCSMCGEVMKDGQTYQGTSIDTSNHASKEIHTHAATCTTKGYSIHYCAYCKKEYGEPFSYVAALDHDYSVQQTISDATAAADRTYTLVCSRCGTGDGETHIDTGTHLDINVPHIYGTAYLASLGHTTYCCVVDTDYHDSMYKGSVCGKKYEYYSYMENVVQCTDPLGVSFHAGAIDEESGIRQYQIAVLNITKEEFEGIIKNNTQEYVEQLVNNYVSTGLMMSNAQNVSIGTYVSMLGKSGTYGYMYILVEDMAGNITIVSTESLLF